MPSPLVDIGIVTWQPDALIERCVEAVRAQTYAHVRLRVWDNGATEASEARLARCTTADEYIGSPENVGFAGGHNALIRQGTGAYYLCLNPDAVIGPTYVATLVETLETRPRVGSATGRILRLRADESAPMVELDDDVIDSTGMVMTPDQRHLDRGADQPSAGRYLGDPETIFGPSGAIALYRRAMLEDIALDAEYFDHEFFAYREDADLAWRAQWRGWDSLYVPTALARHRRRVTPERRSALPATINRYSVRNRFLLRLKNQSAGLAWRFAVPGTVRDAQVIGYVLLREWTSIPGLIDVGRLLPRMWTWRRHVLGRATRRTEDLAPWFRSPRP